jgi:DNA repair protein SbcC/Rad50
LTGTVYRVESDFRSRCSSSEISTEKANKGILRNRSGEDKPVFVKIEAIYMAQKITISRTYNGNLDSDGLKISLPVVECGNSEVKDNFIKNLEVLIEKFNDTYVCSYDKNIELYSKGRNQIYELFSGFYRDHIDAKNILNNLEEIKKRLDVEKKEIENELKIIGVKKSNSIDIAKNVQLIINEGYGKEQYPETKIYEGENLNPFYWGNNDTEKDLTIEDKLQRQIDKLNEIKLNYIGDELGKFKLYLSWKVKSEDYKKLQIEFNNNADKIKRLKGLIIDDLGQEKDIIEEKLRKIRNVTTFEQLESNYKNINLDAILTNDFKEELGRRIFDLRNNQNELIILRKNIELYSTNNQVLKSVRLIIDGLEGFNKYREYNERCPLCGSKDEFLQSELGIVAEQFLGEQDKERQNLSKKIEELSNKNNKLLRDTKEYIVNIYNEILIRMKELLSTMDACKLFLDLCKKYSIDYKLVNDEFFEREVNELSKSIVINQYGPGREKELLNLILEQNYTFSSEFKVKTNQEQFEKINSQDKLNLMSGLISRIEKYLKMADGFSKFNPFNNPTVNISDLDKRINICTYLKSNMQLTKLNEEVNKNTKIEDETKERAIKVDVQISKTTNLIKDIKKLIKTSEIEQAQRIAEPLDKIYRKITRNTNIKRIVFERAKTQNPNAELKIIDYENKESQFANVLSAGQLSTLAISIFLSKAMLNKDSDLRCYFMDEPIQTMDDLNILSFVDLLRFQLKNNKGNESFIDQIFISTCDSDLEKLILHKMSSFGVPICEYRFEGPNNLIRNVIE